MLVEAAGARQSATARLTFDLPRQARRRSIVRGRLVCRPGWGRVDLGLPEPRDLAAQQLELLGDGAHDPVEVAERLFEIRYFDFELHEPLFFHPSLVARRTFAVHRGHAR